MVYKFQASSPDELSFFPRVWSAVFSQVWRGSIFKFCVYKSSYNRGGMTWTAWRCTFFYLLATLTSLSCVMGHKMLFDQIQIIMARVETQNWYLKTPMADAFLLLIQRKFEIFWDVSPHFFSDLVKAFRSSTSHNLWISSLGSLLLMCSGSLSKVSANETDTGTCLFSNNRFFVNCLCLLMSCTVSNQARRHVGKFPFSETLV